MSKKQTAVEWYRRQIMAVFTGESETQQMTEPEIYALAIKMEREQIVEAFQTEWSQHNYSGEQYYANTYGKEASHE